MTTQITRFIFLAATVLVCVSARAGDSALAISIAATPDPVRAEDALTFSGTVANLGTNSSGSFTLFAQVPPFTQADRQQTQNATCVESPGAQVCSAGQTLAWSMSSLTPGATATRAFTVRVAPDNVPVEGTPLATAFSTSITAGTIGRSAVFGGVSANVSVEAPPFTVASNESLTYRLTASNLSDQVQSNTLVLEVPPGVSVDAASDGGVIGSGVVTWPLSDRDPGAIDRVSATVSTGAIASGSLLVADADLRSAASASSLARARVVTAADSLLEVAVTQTLDAVLAGQDAIFTIALANRTDISTGSFTLFATVPNQTTVPGNDDDGASCNGSSSADCPAGNTLVWSLSSLAPGATATRTFTANVNTAPAPVSGTQLTTVVTTSTTSGSSATGSVLVGTDGPVVVLDGAPGIAAANGINRLRLTATNAAMVARTVDLVMDMPRDSAPLLVSDGGSAMGAVATWPAITLAPGGIAQRFVDIQSAAEPQNQLQLVEARARDVSSGTAPARTRAILATDDSIEKTVSVTPSPVLAGEPVTYAITVANTGASSTGSFALRARVPAATVVPGAQDQGASCGGSSSADCTAGQTLTWSVSSLAPGASTTRGFTAVVDTAPAPTAGSVLATVVTTSVQSGAAVTGHAVVAEDSDADQVFDYQDNCTLVENADQRDTDGDGYGNACDADLNNDGTVNFVDLGFLRLSFFTAGPGLDADFNGDNVINFIDLGIMRTLFFAPPGPGQPGDSQQ